VGQTTIWDERTKVTGILHRHFPKLFQLWNPHGENEEHRNPKLIHTITVMIL